LSGWGGGIGGWKKKVKSWGSHVVPKKSSASSKKLEEGSKKAVGQQIISRRERGRDQREINQNLKKVREKNRDSAKKNCVKTHMTEKLPIGNDKIGRKGLGFGAGGWKRERIGRLIGW